jgi:hypothetical protein
MANLTQATATRVAAVKIVEQFSAPAKETIDPGQPVCIDGTAGTLSLASATTSEGVQRVCGIALSGGIAGQAITVLRKGWVDLGDVLDGMDYDTDVWLSATAGLLADEDPTDTGIEGIIVGTVVPAFGHTTADKVLRVDQ